MRPPSGPPPARTSGCGPNSPPPTPAEAALIEAHKTGAYGTVYAHDERDCNPAQALQMAR